ERRILILGAGSIGTRHLANLRQLDAGPLAVYDVDATRSERAAAQHGARAFSDLDAALAWQPELALIATPNHLHVAQAQRCAEIGAHLFVEKPLANALDGIDTLERTL